MNNKQFLLFIISIVLISVAFVTLIGAIIGQAIFDGSNAMPEIFAMISFVFAFASIITFCIYGKGQQK